MLATDSSSPPLPLSDPIGDPSFWPLDGSYDFLNHGSFGSVPFVVQEAQRRHRDAIESRPIEMLGRRCRELLEPARVALARLVGAEPKAVGFVTNATEGVNAVLRSIDLRPGDVLVTTDHVYNAVRQAMRYVARRAGAEIRIVDVPVPLDDPNDVVERLGAAIDPRTRLVLVDHITSPTALVLPVADIVRMCRERGVECLVDGAHAPGMLPLDVTALAPTYYTGNLHKWVCAPKGCGFLWVNDARRRAVHPATVSHFLDEGFDVEFDWQGTRDISAWMAARDAIAMWDAVGWDRMRAHNHGLARWVQRSLCERFGTDPLTPHDGHRGRQMIGFMTTVPLPAEAQARFETVETFAAALYERFRIEIPIIAWAGRWHCRASCQVYNRPQQYRRLADAVIALARGDASESGASPSR